MRRALTVLALLAAAALSLAAVLHGGARPARPSHRAESTPKRPAPPKPKPAPVRPPQFVVVGFDGSGGLQMWRYWDAVAKRAHAHFTFFVSGVYLIDWAHRMEYRPPEHDRGDSAIGFAETTGDLTIANTIRGIAAGYRAGQEIGTHYNGHFCSPDPEGVGSWTAADWQSELDQFDRFLFGAGRLPFGKREIVGSRSPCLEGKPKVLYPVLARNGFLYDTSEQAAFGTWPKRELGIWSFPLPEIPFSGHTFRAIAMDYNFFANQVGESPAQAESEVYRSLWNAFLASYHGGRAPLEVGQHFETWDSWAYDKALARFLVKACGLPEVRCDSYRQVVAFLDSVPKARLRRYEAGRFPPLRTSLGR